MRILVLGGTSFVGRVIVESAVAQGHEVTIFNRNRTNSNLFPEIPRLAGDRDNGDYHALSGTTWDSVVDVSAYLPRHVRQVTDALADRLGRYLLISTGAVYDPVGAKPGLDEDSARLAPEYRSEDIHWTSYGPLKVACEDEALVRYGQRATIVRPGVVAGPHDSSDRFTYWVRRAARGGRIAVVGDPDQPVQLIDSRDLAALVVALLTEDRAGTYNAVGPQSPVTLAQMIQECARVAGRPVELAVLPVGAVEPPMPLVMADPSRYALRQLSAARARAAGMPATALSVTAQDVLTWDRDRGEPELSVGLTADQETALLASGSRHIG